MKGVFAVGVAIAFPQLAMATGMYQCEPVAQGQWLPEASLTEMLEADGWRVRRMKVDGGCWEVYGTTPEGKRVEAYFHPASGELLLLNQRGRIIFRSKD
ncbi:MAG: PepSY domain-containing protein [Paracoccaceae bacterium]|nr:PepSY domain-containing protein [Paracoccaceae bacterium]